jgi:phosphatidylinositol glycan class N
LNFPVNSVGELPLDFLSCGIEDKSKIAFANALEIAEQYTVKERFVSLISSIDNRSENGDRSSV